MNASSLFATTMLVVLATLGNARADHRLDRELDDLNNLAMTHARDARWEVADHFGDTRDYAELREDSRALTNALRNIEDAIFMERSPRTILALMDDAHDVVNHFEEDVDRSEFGRISWRRGVRIRPAGSARVTSLKSILKTLHDDIDAMITVLERADGLQDSSHELEVIPAVPYRVDPGVLVPDLSASSEVVIPLVRTRSGDGVLRMQLH